MNKFIVLTCMAIALAVGMSVQTQAAAPAPFQSANSWPPPPKAIVNWSSEQEYGLTMPVVVAGSELVLMTVPADRWFILTEAKSLQIGNEARLISRDGTGERILMRHIGSAANHHDSSRGGGALGFAFPPGSDVVLRNMATSAGTLSQLARFTGYYARGE